jgi:phosphopantothenoylcysteine decarboxylase/phosphopantothenate--cysteine ligase
VRESLWDSAAEAAMGHIELARWADLVLVAPASADFMARLAHGRADDLLSTLCLATAAPIVLAPAMNQQMWANAATQANVATLTQRGVRLLGPGIGEQACGELGPGRMLEPAASPSRNSCAHAHRSIVATRTERARRCTRGQHGVRFVSNRSSGKMGYAIAEAMRAAGAEVVLVSGPVSLPVPPGVRCIGVESAAQMLEVVQQGIAGHAHISGHRRGGRLSTADGGRSQDQEETEQLSLEMTRTTDILATVAAGRERPFVVGFAAEDPTRSSRALEAERRTSMIAANEVGASKGLRLRAMHCWCYGAVAGALNSSARPSAAGSALVALIATHCKAKP